ncbi:hypothetical protein QVD99_003586 [Batrachochytrium dendrobatidis]|nr:hypothetical protein QVD99_003586 [Batrachochytrium dendrobatidis]
MAKLTLQKTCNSNGIMSNEPVDPLLECEGRLALERLNVLMESNLDMEDCNSTASQINPERLLSMSLPSHQDNCSSDMNVDHNSLLFRLFSAHPLAHVQIDSIQQDLIVADPRVFEVSDEQDALLRSAFETIMISTVDILKESVLPSSISKGTVITINKKGHVVDPIVLARGGREFTPSSRRPMSSRRRRVEQEIKAGKIARRPSSNSRQSNTNHTPFHWLKQHQPVFSRGNQSGFRGRGMRGSRQGFGRGRGMGYSGISP